MHLRRQILFFEIEARSQAKGWKLTGLDTSVDGSWGALAESRRLFDGHIGLPEGVECGWKWLLGCLFVLLHGIDPSSLGIGSLP